MVVWGEGMFEINSIQTASYFLQLRWMVVGVKLHQYWLVGGSGCVEERWNKDNIHTLIKLLHISFR